jgi:hypothetical protein
MFTTHLGKGRIYFPTAELSLQGVGNTGQKKLLDWEGAEAWYGRDCEQVAK